MRKQILIALAGLCIFLFCIVDLSLSSEISGWVKSETCWVTERPSTKAQIIGIILRKSSVMVKDVGRGWARIVFAPVRDPQTGKYLNCANRACYIRKRDITTIPPGRW